MLNKHDLIEPFEAAKYINYASIDDIVALINQYHTKKRTGLKIWEIILIKNALKIILKSYDNLEEKEIIINKSDFIDENLRIYTSKEFNNLFIQCQGQKIEQG